MPQSNQIYSPRCDRIRHECIQDFCSLDIPNGYLQGYLNNVGSLNTLHCSPGYVNNVDDKIQIKVKW